MEWREYLKVLLRHKRIIITAVLICVGTAGFLSYWQQATYEAVSAITISNDNIVALQTDNGTISSLDALRDAFTETSSIGLAEKVIEETGIKITPSRLVRMVRVGTAVDVLGSSITKNDQAQVPIIEIAVTDTDRNRATRLANAYASAAVEDSRISADAKIMKTLKLVDKELEKYQKVLSTASAQSNALNQGFPIIDPDGTIRLSTTGSPNVDAYIELGRIVRDYNALSEKKNVLQLMQINTVNPPLKIYKNAQTANRVQTTMPVSVLLGLLVGITLGIGGIGVLEYFGDRPKTPKEIEALFQTPVLGSVITYSEDINQHLGVDGEPPLAEDYRLLRTRLKTSTSEKEMRSFLIASPLNERCAPIVLSNLATVFAQSGATVLIIASDLRDSKVVPFFFSDYKETGGLSDWLMRGGTFGNLIVETGVKHLYILPPGARDDNAIKRLDTAQIEELLTKVRNKVDYVFLEGPPINKFADASILAAAVDGIVLVATHDEITPLIVGNAIRRLEFVKDRIVGIVDAGTTEN